MTIYVAETIHARIRQKAMHEGIPVQEIVAHAVNAGLRAQGAEPLLNPLRLRVFMRKNGAAGLRTSPKPSRNGKYALSGWYDRKDVEALKAYCASNRTSAQDLSSTGMEEWLTTSAAGSIRSHHPTADDPAPSCDAADPASRHPDRVDEPIS